MSTEAAAEAAEVGEIDEPSIKFPRHVGAYWAVALLGRGRLSSVLLAVQPAEGDRPARLAVLKRPRSGQAVHDTHFVEMFMDESRLAQRVQHPNVAKIYSVGDDDVVPYIALEFVHGQSLAVLASAAKHAGRKVPVPVALTVFDEVLAALAYAHDLADFDGKPLNVIHRDVTPTNVFVEYDGAAKLVDFGIAKSVMQREKTGVGLIKGKMPYLAPEQLLDKPVTRAADLWSLGVTLWELLAGESLFAGKNDFETIQNVMKREVPKLAARRDDVPAALDAALARALARDPADRPATAAELRALLAQAGPGAGREGVAAFMRELFAEAREKNAVLLEKFRTAETSTVPLTAGFLRFTETGVLEPYDDPSQIPHTGDRVRSKPESLRPGAAAAPPTEANQAKPAAPPGSAGKQPGRVGESWAGSHGDGEGEHEEEGRPAWHWAALLLALGVGAAGVWFLTAR